MSEELDILRIVADNPAISQRKIAEKTGISLGQVNFLIKKCVKKGLIKIEGQTSKSLKYNLTPKGITEKASLTFEYIKISLEAIMALSNKIEVLAKNYEALGKKIYIYGADDEMMQIIRLALNGNKIMGLILENAKCIEAIDQNYIVFSWETGLKEELERKNINVINILE